MYCQCHLKNLDGRSTTSWIPKEFAVLGMSLRLRIPEGWDNGWIVDYAGQCQENPPYIPTEIKQHRKHTGDSLPKVS